MSNLDDTPLTGLERYQAAAAWQKQEVCTEKKAEAQKAFFGRAYSLGYMPSEKVLKDLEAQHLLDKLETDTGITPDLLPPDILSKIQTVISKELIRLVKREVQAAYTAAVEVEKQNRIEADYQPSDYDYLESMSSMLSDDEYIEYSTGMDSADQDPPPPAWEYTPLLPRHESPHQDYHALADTLGVHPGVYVHSDLWQLDIVTPSDTDDPSTRRGYWEHIEGQAEPVHFQL